MSAGAAALIEVAGPAGAGKSSLVQMLRTRDAHLLGNVQLPPAAYLRDACGLLPTFARFHRPFRGVMRKQMKRALYLTTLHRVLGSQRRHEIRLLDEGPVYMLARMLYFGGPQLENEHVRQWWLTATTQWARALHLVIVLDADSLVLARRIRARSGRPPVHDTRDASLLAFLDRYRQCYATVLRELARDGGGPAVLSLDTGCMTLQAVANRVISAVSSCPR